VKDLDYFERLVRDLNDARQIQANSSLSLNVDNAMNKTLSDLNGYFKSEIEASKELDEEMTRLVSGIGSNVLSIVSDVKRLYSENLISVKSKIEILNEMILIADESAKKARENMKKAIEEESSIAVDDESIQPKKRDRPDDIRKTGERPVTIKEKRSKSAKKE